jgi:LCP family protein required for cell wall assembly
VSSLGADVMPVERTALKIGRKVADGTGVQRMGAVTSNEEGGTGARQRAPGLLDVVLAALVPGLPTLRRRPVHGALLIVAGLVGPIVWAVVTVVRHRSWIDVGLDRSVLDQLVGVIAVMLIARMAGVGEVLAAGSARPGAGVRRAVAFATLLAVGVPSAFAVAAVSHARDDIDRTFGSAADRPVFDATAVHTVPTTEPSARPVASTVAPSTTVAISVPELHREIIAHGRTAPDSGVDPAQLADVRTILLLGGDAGPGRSGLRTDSMILLSIHEPSGRAGLVSFPRDARNLLFPPGTYLAEQFPNGYDDIANAIYPRVSYYDEWRAAYEGEGMRPGAVAITQAIGYSLDVTIDDYVVIDMQGFLEVVDALGGVTVDVPKSVPTPGNIPGARHEVPEVIPAGVQHMDGTTALAYVRSRKADSDYSRMARQRAVLSALASQVSITDAIGSYTRITSALGASVHTTMSAAEFAELLGLLGAGTAIVESVGFTPPLISPADPDYDDMAKILGRVQLALVVGEPSGY